MQKKYQVSLISITLMLVCSILVATSYAYWSVTEVQEDTNILTSGCFDATLEGKNAITLDNAYPMTNEEGKSTTVYSFTIKNTCSIDSSYVVNLEALKGSNLGGEYIKVAFNGGTPVLYSSLESVQTVVTDSVDSKKLVTGNLIAGGSITYTLQLWMDESATTDQAGQVFDSKIIVTTEATKMDDTLAKRIIAANPLVEIEPTLTTSSNNTTDPSGLYKSTLTNSGSPTYYFRGNVTNNYVSFAGFTWRIVRVNEDGTVRLIMQDGINSKQGYLFNSTISSITNMYYSQSDIAKPTLDDWYINNIESKGFGSLVSTGDYYCEQAKVAVNDSYISGSGAAMNVYSSYAPNYKCSNDTNNHGIVNSNVGLITYDEVIFAGGYYGTENDNYYLYNEGNSMWTMSPAGYANSTATMWYANIQLNINSTISSYIFKPVINLKADVTAVGLGTESNPYYIN